MKKKIVDSERLRMIKKVCLRVFVSSVNETLHSYDVDDENDSTS